MAEIGFGKAPEKTETWDKKVDGVTFLFSKTREKEGVFSYNCTCKRNSPSGLVCGFQTDRDLDREEIESRPQFLDFIASQL
jgi:hypothetical protein